MTIAILLAILILGIANFWYIKKMADEDWNIEESEEMVKLYTQANYLAMLNQKRLYKRALVIVTGGKTPEYYAALTDAARQLEAEDGDDLAAHLSSDLEHGLKYKV